MKKSKNLEVRSEKSSEAESFSIPNSQFLIPPLRFPEFRGKEGWTGATLGDLSEVVRGGSPRPIDGFLTTAADGLNWLKIGDVDKEAKYVTHTAEKVRPEALSKTRVVNPGDLILSNSMSFGRPYILQIKTCIHDGWIAITEIAKKADRDFLYYSISAPSSQSYFVDNAAGSGVQNLNADIIKALPVTFPSPAEQQKIAECLSSVDEVIAAQARKLDALKTHKKGLMQQLFPREGETQPRLRFPEFQNAGEWEVKRLGDIAEVAASGDLVAATFSPEPSEEHRFPIYSNAVEKEGIYGFSSVARYPANSVTITARGTLGRAFLRTTDFVGIGRLIVVSKFTGKAAPNFLKECWDHLAVIPHEVTSIPQLTAVAARATALPFPSLPEQHRIATCLSSLDALIAAETQKHAALQRHKRGLMQQLFPSPEKTS